MQTKPQVDSLASGLEESWQSLVDTFGSNNILIVSNSAGVAAKDSLLLQVRLHKIQSSFAPLARCS